MVQGMTHRRAHWLVAAVALALLALIGAPPGEAKREKGETVTTTINLPVFLTDNICNGDVVNLHGDLTITTTTTPRRNGGFTVESSAIARNLEGERIAPPPAIGYRGDDGENTFSYFAPPPYPSSHRVVHWTRLIPDGKAPRMYLVVVLRETINADGTVVTAPEQVYLSCKKPKDRGHDKHHKGC
jgi:hypothetical protein